MKFYSRDANAIWAVTGYSINPELQTFVPADLRIDSVGSVADGSSEANVSPLSGLTGVYRWFEETPSGLVDGIKHRVLDDIVLSKIRARFGGNLRAGFVAGAACPSDIIDFMDAIGIPVCEGYGLTETAAPSHNNPPEHAKQQGHERLHRQIRQRRQLLPVSRRIGRRPTLKQALPFIRAELPAI
jgi:acyl-CoA synthetase (AMP-forming)/AMP-acid ligase II